MTIETLVENFNSGLTVFKCYLASIIQNGSVELLHVFMCDCECYHFVLKFSIT